MEQKLKDKLVSLELHLLKKETRASSLELNRLIADDFKEIAASGCCFGKEEAIQRIPNEICPEFSSKDFNVKELSDSVIQITYKATIIKPNEDIVHYSLRSSIWKLNDTGWQMVFHQGTLCDSF